MIYTDSPPTSITHMCVAYICRVVFFFSTQDESCKFNNVRNHVACKVTGYRTGGNENGLASALSNAGPVGVAIDCSRPGFRNYRSGIYDDRSCSTTRLNHAVTAIGYDSNSWIVRNRYLHYLSQEPIISLMYTEKYIQTTTDLCW